MVSRRWSTHQNFVYVYVYKLL